MKVMVTGATGTLGRKVVGNLLRNNHVVVAFSRDEQKQRDLPNHSNLIKVIGDVRDMTALKRASFDCDTIAHFAALKCVDTLQDNPFEAVKTNINGTENICEISYEFGCRLVFTSTDKACAPINVYGNTKAIGESYIMNAGGAICRYGNVLGSRGSVLPMFVKSLLTEKKAYITDPKMSRFWITIDHAAYFVTSIIENELCAGLQIPPIKASPVMLLLRACAIILKVDPYSIETIGLRPGEKIHEQLTTETDGLPESTQPMFSNTYNQFTLSEMVKMIKPIVEEIRDSL